MKLLVGTYGSAIYELVVNLADGSFREEYSAPASNASFIDVGKHLNGGGAVASYRLCRQ